MIHVISTSVAPVRVRDVTVVLHIHTTLQDGLFFCNLGFCSQARAARARKEENNGLLKIVGLLIWGTVT